MKSQPKRLSSSRVIWNLATIRPSLFQIFGCLAADLGLPTRDVETMKARFTHEGDRFFTKALPLLGKALDRGFQTLNFSCPPNFRRRCRSALPAFLGSYFAKVFTSDGSLRDDADSVAVYALRQVCFFAYKANQPYREDDKQKVIDGFVSTESELSNVKVEEDALLFVASNLVGNIFQGFSMEDIIGKHGPGVTANVKLGEKYEARLDGTLPSVRKYYHKFWFNENDQWYRIDRHPVATHHALLRDNNIARVILVPKDSRGPRLISCEPAENQYLQQGIRKFMETRLQGHPISGGHVNFEDQKINRALAKKASETQEFATLDLKDASDRVTLELVQRVFSRSPALLDALLTTRSTRTKLPNGQIVWMKKFAPMGSACCFPVLSTCVYAISFAYVLGISGSATVASESVYVYGDDLVVATPYAHGVIGALERYGLKVNVDKSFINSNFAESCGFDAFKGNDVTPIRLKKWYQIDGNTGLHSVLVSTCATAQLLSAAGLFLTSELLYSFVERRLGQLPYCTQRSPYLGRWTPYASTVPERILLKQRGVKWVDLRTNHILAEQYPLLSHLKAWFVKPVDREFPASAYGHMQRTWSQLGVEESELPEWGLFNLPRDWVLRKKSFDHYAMT